MHETAIRDRPKRGAGWSLLAVLLGGVTLIVGKGLAPGDAWFVVRLVGGAIVSTGVVAFVVAAPREWPIVRLLETRPFRHIGQISYGLYLYHHPIYYYLLWQSESAPPVTTVVLAVLASYGVAMASYTLWERPFLRLKDLWATPKPKP